MNKSTFVFLGLLVCSCGSDNGVDSKEEGASTATALSTEELDALVGEWEVQFNEDASVGFEFETGDMYEIRKKNDKYYLVVKANMYGRESWKQHKDKEFKLSEIDRDPESDYLCADGIKLGDHAGVTGGDKKHVIAFVAKDDASSQLISGDHLDPNTCESLDTHGGRAHSQT
jgi:hypothetical protein